MNAVSNNNIQVERILKFSNILVQCKFLNYDHHIDASQHFSVYEGNNNAMIIFQYRLIRVCSGVIYLKENDQ